jgi:hypothetical protein
MSTRSHAKHEHKHQYDPVMDELEAMEADSFAKRHKTLIWVVIIGAFVMLPVVFGVLALLGAL